MRLLLCLAALVLAAYAIDEVCHPFFVRWPRVRLNAKAVAGGRLGLRACQSACAIGEDPVTPGKRLECAAMNHETAADRFSHKCDVFQPHQLQNLDGYVEADDRYSFYWKYCLGTDRKCGGEYAFTYLSDRYMDRSEVVSVKHTSTLEDCLTMCLDSASFPCRSVSFNRTDGGCHMSSDSQLTKPQSIHLNNNPNYRIDYYENNCYNMSETFKFNYECKDDGILVTIDSKFPYTGALYGLYDFFTCRTEPKEMKNFEFFFPSPMKSKNCSDSIRYKGNDMVLEVVLSTDGVEPLYFITPDDLTFQARCPIHGSRGNIPIPAVAQRASADVASPSAPASPAEQEQFAASAHALFSMLAKQTKDTFPLPLTAAPHTLAPATKAPVTKGTKAAAATTKAPVTTKTTAKPAGKVTNPVTKPVKVVKTTVTTPKTTTKAATTTTKKAVTSTKAPTTTSSTSKKPVTTTTKATTASTTTRKPTTTTTTTTQKPTTTTSTTTTTTTTTRKPSTTTTTTTTAKPTTAAPVVHRAPVEPKEDTFKLNDQASIIKPIPPQSSIDSIPPLSSKPDVETTTVTSKAVTEKEVGPPGAQDKFGWSAPSPRAPVQFDIFHNGQPVEAVVVGSKVTLAFTPHYAIPPRYMSVRGCQVEPIDSKYEWEREPLPIIQDGCQADLVGLVCPPLASDYGIKVTVESFRYQTTPQVQYSCLVRICPFAPCPVETCPSVDGCAVADPLRTINRYKRALSLDDIRKALEADPSLSRQIGLPSTLLQGSRPTQDLEQQLVALAGDHVVKRRLVVVNSEDQLRYYVRTGDIP